MYEGAQRNAARSVDVVMTLQSGRQAGKAITRTRREIVVVNVASMGCGTKILRKSGFSPSFPHGTGGFTCWVCCIKKKKKKDV